MSDINNLNIVNDNADSKLSAKTQEMRQEVLMRKKSLRADTSFYDNSKESGTEDTHLVSGEDYSLDIRNISSQGSKKRKKPIISPQVTQIEKAALQSQIITNNSSTEKIKVEALKHNARGETFSLANYAEQLQNKVKLINVNNRLYFYNGICYEALNTTELIKLYRDNVNKELHNTKSLRIFEDLYSFMLTDSKLEVQQDFSIVSDYAFLKNGIFNVRCGVLYPHTSDLVAFSYVDAHYKKKAKCDRFERFLEGITEGDEVLIKRFWCFLAYLFMQSTEAKVFFVMGTAPDSGKSVLGRLIQNLFKSKYVSSVALNDLHKEFSLAPIVGTAVNISLDLPDTSLRDSAVSKLKMLTGDDLISINEKYIPLFKYCNRAKFVFATNHPITIVKDDDAFWNRLIYLPFTKSIDKSCQNTRLLSELLEERDDIVSKALNYGKFLLDNSYVFPTTPLVEDTINRWRGNLNSEVNRFVSERCSIGEDLSGETLDNLYNAYLEYCSSNQGTPLSRQGFKNYLENIVGLKHCKIRKECPNPRSAFKGICLESGGRYNEN